MVIAASEAIREVHMGAVTELLGNSAALTVAELGGVAAIVGDQDLLNDDRARLVVGAICEEWDSLADDVRGDASMFIVNAATTTDPFLMNDAIDIALSSLSVLPAVSSTLEARFRAVVNEPGIRAEIALEGWVRLCIGGWGRPLAVRAALDTHVINLLQAGGEPSPYLIRALGAALDVWDDVDLESSMRRLADTGEAPDAAVELAFRSVRNAVEAAEPETATSALQTAIEWFDTALADEERPDARAFRQASMLVQEFSRGRTINSSDASSLRSAVGDYLTGFVGTVPTWRQPRADTALRWLSLIEELEGLRDLDDVWLNAGAVISSVGRVMQASRTMRIVARADSNTSATGNRGLVELVRPRLVAGFSAAADISRQLDRWIQDATDAALIEEIAALREELRGGGDPKASRGLDRPRVGSTAPISPHVRDVLNLDEPTFARMQAAAAEHADLIDVFDKIAARNAGLTVTEEQQVQRLLDAIEAIIEQLEPCRLALYTVCAALVRFASTHINVSQSGETRPQWLGENGKAQPEASFSNALRDWFRAGGLNALREVPDTAGGRSDVLLLVDGHQFVIESKRVQQPRTFNQLTKKYGTQAVQYQATHAPVAFLAVVDYGHRTTRTDLAGSFDVRPWTLPDAARTYALVTLQVLGNVATPSESSR